VTIFKKLSLFSNRWQALSGNKLNRFGITLWIDKVGRDEITRREPQYVFAVNVCLMAHRHSEVDDVVNCPTI